MFGSTLAIHGTISQKIYRPFYPAYYSFRSLAVPVMFGIMLIAYLYIPEYAIFIPPFIPLIMFLVGKYYKKRLAIQAVKKKK